MERPLELEEIEEINEKMATEIMGWHREGVAWRNADGEWMAYADDVFREPAWNPYRDIRDAWLAIEVFVDEYNCIFSVRKIGPQYQLGIMEEYAAKISDGTELAYQDPSCTLTVYAPRATFAICRAMLMVARLESEE